MSALDNARRKRAASRRPTAPPIPASERAFAVGERVSPTDRENIGTVVDTTTDGRILVRFVSREGAAAERSFSAAELRPVDRPAVPAGPPTVRIPAYLPFPVRALPPVLREFVVEVAASVGCDPAFAALPALVVAGAAVGAALVVCPKRKYEQPPLLWLFTVGDSGTGKSPAFKPSADRAFDIDRRLKDDYLAALRKYRAELEAWESADAPEPDAEPAKPVRERFAVIDATIERLTVESTTSPRGLVVARDEADGWLSSFARYKGSGGG